MSFLPKSRTQEYRGNDNRTTTYRCYTVDSAQYYKDITGSYHSIDLTYTQSLSNSNVGSFQLYDVKSVEQIMTHELGHSVGLPHTNDRVNIMYPSYTPSYAYCLIN